MKVIHFDCLFTSRLINLIHQHQLLSVRAHSKIITHYRLVRSCETDDRFISILQIIDLNKSPPFEINSDVPSLPIKIVNQLENDTILIGYSRYVKIISKSGKLKPARKLRSEIGFDFDIEAAVCLPDSVLGFHKHGLQGRSYKDESITQELNDPNKSFKLLCGIGKCDVIMTSSRPHPSPL